MEKVLIITYYWPPSGGAGVQRWLKFTKYLPDYGIEPVVLTVDLQGASYPQLDKTLEQEVSEKVQVYRTRTFEFYQFYKLLTGKKEIPYGGFANEDKISILQRIAKVIRGNFFLPDPRRGWNSYAAKKATELIRTHHIKTVITTSPPHSTQLIGLRLKERLGIRWIADLRDPWTDIYYYHEFHHSSWAIKRDRALELKVLRGADQLVAVNEDMRRNYMQKLPADVAVKFSVIPNGYDETDFLQEPGVTDARFVITYTGTISEAYDMSGFLNAVDMLDRKQQMRLMLRFVGKVSVSLIDHIRLALPELELDFAGYVDHRASVRYLLRSSLQLLIIPKVENNTSIVPGKLFEYMASGKPIMAIGPKGGDLENMINETRAGKLFEYGEKELMLSFLNEALSGHVLPPLPEKVQAYSRKVLAGKMARLLFA